MLMNKKTLLPWIIWSISALLLQLQFSLQLTSGQMISGLMQSFSVTAFGGSVLASSYFYVYVLLQAPAGMLMDCYGPRKLLTIGSIIVFIGGLIFSGAHSFSLALLGRLLMGTGSATAFVGSLNLIARWFPSERFAFIVGIAETIGMIGAIICGSLLATLVESVGWRDSMFAAAILALFIGMLIFIIVRDAPKELLIVKKPLNREFWHDARRLLSLKVTWINGIYSGLTFSVVTVFVALWGIPYLQVTHHLNLLQATLVVNLVFIGVGIGTPTFGWLDEYYDQRKLILFLAPLVSAVLLFVAIFLPALPLPVVGILMIAIGFACSSYVLPFTIAKEIAEENTLTTSIGITNMLCMILVPILQPLIGWLLNFLTKSHENLTVYSYSVLHYQEALSVIPALTLIACVLAYWMPKKHFR